eukprot:TRINITY_DN4969_c0_g1_i1.p1 TRINITY_DN4969_c0_g1~~TRINITY_DN4969_c0_g1_i1.p1  ORF type:complete len:223 (+),score=54.09 TRINITY_DN4969_c0_g1_i1:283-951(+)
MFNLGPNSELVFNNFTNITQLLQQLNLKSYAMISSYPYPKDFIVWMRQLFKNPQPFFKDCITWSKIFQFTGFNVDFEPDAGIIPSDADDYVKFLNEFADVLHQNNLELTVDIATWSTLWDWPKLSQTKVDKFMIMSTYTGNETAWLIDFNKAIKDFPVEKIGIGLQTVNPNTGQPLTDQELEFRFQHILGGGIQEIDIWRMPIYQNWWGYIQQFLTPNSQPN